MVRGDIDAKNQITRANSVAHSFHPWNYGKATATIMVNVFIAIPDCASRGL
jgi:hypothetical protein